MRIGGIGWLIGKGKFSGRGVSEAKAEDEVEVKPSNPKEGEGEAFEGVHFVCMYEGKFSGRGACPDTREDGADVSLGNA